MKYHDNIQGLVALQPDYIGFIFYPKSPRYIVGVLPPEMVSAIPADIKKVGVFVNEEIVEVKKQVDAYQLDMVQLHGAESPEYCQELQKSSAVMKAFPMSDDFDFSQLESYSERVDYFLFDTKTPKYGGSGKQFNWQLLKNYQLKTPFFLSGGIGANDIDSISELALENLYAIDINSKVEIDPGLKDLNLIHGIKEKLMNKIDEV